MKRVRWQRAATSLPACIICILFLGLADWVTGYEIGLFVFYFLPISIVAWKTTPRKGYAMCLLSAAAWFLADWYAGHEYSHSALAAWETGTRLLSFIAISYFTSRTRALITHERTLSQELRSALDQVKTLSGLLPICASCKKIRDDRGYWNQIESYISDHSQVEFSHGICPDCANKLYPEFLNREVGS